MAGAGRLCMNFPRVAPLSGSSHLALPHKSPPRRARLCIVTLQFSVMTRTLHKQCAKCLYLSPSLPFLLSAAAVSAASIVIVYFGHRISYVSSAQHKNERETAPIAAPLCASKARGRCPALCGYSQRHIQIHVLRTASSTRWPCQNRHAARTNC